MLDTAISYGNAEQVVGQTIGAIDSKKEWKIITKTPHFKVKKISLKQSNDLIEQFFASLQALQCEQVYGLMIHNCNDLFVKGGERLFATMQQLKQQGVVKKIGVSLYNNDQIRHLLEVYPIDLVQLPINILDQRLLKEGGLIKLKERGVEIHARSVFLQGLLLMESKQRSAWFTPISDKLDEFHRRAQECKLSRLQLALGFVMSIPEIDQVVIGVNNLEQLQEIMEVQKLEINAADYKMLSLDDPFFLNPSNWKVSA